MKRFRKKPVEVEAVQWDGTAEGASDIIDWILGNGQSATYMCSDPVRCRDTSGDTPHTISIRTLEGDMTVSLNDYVIKGTRGEFYPCKPEPFSDTFEEIL